MGSPKYNETLALVDDLYEHCRTRRIGLDTFTSEVIDAFYGYLTDEDPRDDVNGLLDYCVDQVRHVCDLNVFADRVLPYRIENQLRWILDQQIDGKSLSQTILDLRTRLQADDHNVQEEILTLCEHGYETDCAMFSAIDAERDLLTLAYEYSLVDALAAAVRPSSPGRLANSDKSRGRALPLVLDMLGHLASDPYATAGTEARDVLIELCGYPETLGLAALRLPVHLLSADQRDTLHDMYVVLDDSLAAVTVPIFTENERIRDREIMRSALWQTNDALRLGSANQPPAA